MVLKLSFNQLNSFSSIVYSLLCSRYYFPCSLAPKRKQNNILNRFARLHFVTAAMHSRNAYLRLRTNALTSGGTETAGHRTISVFKYALAKCGVCVPHVSWSFAPSLIEVPYRLA